MRGTFARSYWNSDLLAEASGEKDLATNFWRGCHALLEHLTEAGFELEQELRDLHRKLNRTLSGLE